MRGSNARFARFTVISSTLNRDFELSILRGIRFEIFLFFDRCCEKKENVYKYYGQYARAILNLVAFSILRAYRKSISKSVIENLCHFRYIPRQIVIKQTKKSMKENPSWLRRTNYSKCARKIDSSQPISDKRTSGDVLSSNVTNLQFTRR